MKRLGLPRSVPVIGQDHIFPFTADDGLANLLRTLSLTMHLVSKENLLDADFSTSAVIIAIAIQQAAVAKPVAVTVAGLLRQHAWNAFGDTVSLGYHRITEERGRERLWKWFSLSFAGIKRWCLRRDGRSW
jgi:hypothetical protein